MLIEMEKALEEVKIRRIFYVDEKSLKKCIEKVDTKKYPWRDPYYDGIEEYIFTRKLTDPYVFISNISIKDIKVEQICNNLLNKGIIGEKLCTAIKKPCFIGMFAEIMRCLIYQENEKLFTGEDTDIIEHLNNVLKNAKAAKDKKCDYRDALVTDVKYPMLAIKRLFGDEDYLRFNPIDPETLKRKPAGYYNNRLIILQCPLAPEEIKCIKTDKGYICSCTKGCWTKGNAPYEAIEKFNNSIIKGRMRICS